MKLISRMIDVAGLTFAYGPQVLRFPDFTVSRSEPCLLLGESGSGKTTLLHVLGGLLRNYNGSVKIDGTELSTLSESGLDKFRGQKLGFVFQRNHLIQALSVEQNLMMAPYLAGLTINESRIRETLASLNLAEKRKSKVTQISHGQAQRVAIARAILNHPPVILADEPTSALDDTNCDHVIRLLLEVAAQQGAALVVATHDQRLKSKIEKQIILRT